MDEPILQCRTDRHTLRGWQQTRRDTLVLTAVCEPTCIRTYNVRTITSPIAEGGIFIINSHNGRQRTTQTADIKNAVLGAMRRNTCTSSHVLERDISVDRYSILRILREDGQYSYHVQRMQALLNGLSPMCGIRTFVCDRRPTISINGAVHR